MKKQVKVKAGKASEVRNIGSPHTQPFEGDLIVQDGIVTVRGRLGELVGEACEKLGITHQQFFEDAMGHMLAKEKAQGELESVEYFDLGCGIALDPQDRVFKVYGEIPKDDFLETGKVRSTEPMTLAGALRWLADQHTAEGFGSDLNYPRFFRLVASKLPEGV